ncbi:MAG TPA: DUF1579 family protein [Candidatus Binatia bacterium]|nr:DUF1579 family protein [Candidatus Binatia bacterium]
MTTIRKGAILIAVLAMCLTTLSAQEAAAPSGSKAAKSAQAPAMPMPKPAPEMTKLIKMMAGNWTVTEKHYPNPMMPNGGSGKGTAMLTPGPAGLSMMEKYHSSGAMGENFNGLGVFWWDSKAQVYRGMWCDNMTPGGCDTSGTTKWEGDNLVGTMESEMNGQKMASRFTYSDWKPNSFVMTMEMGPDVNSMKKAMTITYTKVAKAGAAGKATQP